MSYPMDHCIKQINTDTWLIGSLVLQRSNCSPCLATWNDDKETSFTLTKAPEPPPPATSLPPSSPYIQLVYNAGGRPGGGGSRVYSIGKNAFCKVHTIERGATPEPATIDFVRKKQPNFALPGVLHYVEHGDWYYLFTSRVPGRTLADAWPTLTEHWRQHYVNVVVNICKDMAEWTSNKLSGADGRNVAEYYLQKDTTPGTVKDFSPASLARECKVMGLDCSRFHFYHTDLGPGNIIVEIVPESGTVGIIDWETAGYFPRAWIRTKFRLSGGMDLPDYDDPHRWRAEVQKSLGNNGFEDCVDGWQLWSKNR